MRKNNLKINETKEINKSIEASIKQSRLSSRMDESSLFVTES